MVEFRLAGQEAAADLARLWARANARRIDTTVPAAADPASVDALAGRLATPGTVATVAVDDGDIVAGCFVQPFKRPDGTVVDGLGHLSGLAVDPARWGEGLASGVLTHALDRLRGSGVTRVQLHVLEQNDRARRLYEHLGWRLVELGVPHPDDGPQAIYERAVDDK